ncbi:dipeptidyl aminopeptidase/acylaminoacyl peptidase [Dongia mobilis]|uniref:Dipeptidyl aminopeptidase/acylaminoacyl peptidase n=1 Tax=Dongia mobilis TaxID=578943 RepID=A0A4R6WRS2_9PROT|nr:alpha/beta fold hydrolase [Dongia mobilis]TDQ84206.1 dipeptidyl aminopeptidase/acylaminoacyl peptidase [Dongia mobilis]
MTLDLTRFDPFLARLLSLPTLYGAVLSPDGSQLALIWGKLGPTAQLWLQPADGSASPRCLVSDKWDCDYVIWSRDGRSLIVGQSQEGDERISLLQVFLDGRPSRRLTPEAPDYYIHGGQLLGDNRHLVYAANLDPETGAEIEESVVYLHDIETGGKRALARTERPAFCWPVVSPDDQLVLYERKDRHPAGYQLWLAAIDGSFDREIVNLGDDIKVDGTWSPDGAHIVLTADSRQGRRIGLWHRATEAIDWLVDDPARNVEDADWPRRAPHLVIEEVRHARSHHFLLDPVTRGEAAFQPGPGTYAPIGVDAGGHWLAWHYSAAIPSRILRLEGLPPFREVNRLARHPADPGLAPDELAAAEDYRWHSVDGLEIQGWLYRAKGAPHGTILLVHGGPTHHDEDSFDPEIQYYAACGFNVLTPNYRGSTGFSLAYEEAIKQEGWGGLEQEDIRTGAESLIRDGIARPGKVGITGTSYGGYSSWWAITRFPVETIAAAAPICGMTDLVVDYETTRPDLRPYSEEMMGGSPATAPARYRDRSPIHFVENIRGRLLIVQGENDPNVTPQNVTDVTRRLDAAGISFDLLTFPDEGHGIARPENQRVLYRRIAGFFAAAFD